MEALEVMLLQMLKQICVQELEDEALVLSKVDMLDQSHDVVLISRVFIHEEPQQFTLLLGKLVIDLCVPVDLDSDSHACHVINR